MKRLIAFATLILMMVVLQACSTEVSLEIVEQEVTLDSSSSMIVNHGEKAGEYVDITNLTYKITIKNNGSETVRINNKDLLADVVPNEELRNISKEIVGFDIFNISEYYETGLFIGLVVPPSIEPNSVAEYVLHYPLGINEIVQDVPLVPSDEWLEKIKKHAFDATFILGIDDDEVARFDLSKSNK